MYNFCSFVCEIHNGSVCKIHNGSVCEIHIFTCFCGVRFHFSIQLTVAIKQLKRIKFVVRENQVCGSWQSSSWFVTIKFVVRDNQVRGSWESSSDDTACYWANEWAKLTLHCKPVYTVFYNWLPFMQHHFYFLFSILCNPGNVSPRGWKKCLSSPAFLTWRK